RPPREDSMSARHEYHPEETRKKISHPIIDGDGHWIEYTPVFAERMRKVVGDKGAGGFLASQRRIPDALSQTIEQRKARGAAMEGHRPASRAACRVLRPVRARQRLRLRPGLAEMR